MGERIETRNVDNAPAPLGSYSHVAIVGDLIFVCGMGPRHPVTSEVDGLVVTPDGKKFRYDIRKETQATIENLKTILESVGSALERVVEVNVFLTDMKDFSQMNDVYGMYFGEHRPVRTTLGVNALPGNISVEMKATALKL